MINKVNIDVRIYVDHLMEGINQMGMIETIAAEWGIRNEDEFKELLTENITLQASLNFEENGDPVLGEKQFEDVLVRSATEHTVEEMVNEGILTKKLDEDGIENTYSIKTEKDGKDRGRKEENPEDNRLQLLSELLSPRSDLVGGYDYAQK